MGIGISPNHESPDPNISITRHNDGPLLSSAVYVQDSIICRKNRGVLLNMVYAVIYNRDIEKKGKKTVNSYYILVQYCSKTSFIHIIPGLVSVNNAVGVTLPKTL